MSIFNINANGVSGRSWLSLVFIPFLLLTCKPESSSDIQKQAIFSVMDKQESAWNKGDIDRFMKGYLKSDSLCFIGSKGLTYGWHKTLDNYKKSYPGKSAMGKLKFTNLEFKSLNAKYAYVIGKWKLMRNKDTLSGHYSLLWKKTTRGWKIIADHSS